MPESSWFVAGCFDPLQDGSMCGKCFICKNMKPKNASCGGCGSRRCATCAESAEAFVAPIRERMKAAAAAEARGHK